MKIIRISDKLHTKLKEHADIDRRTINGEAEIILELYFSDAEGGLSSEQVAKNRIKEAQEVKEYIVNEGKELGLLDKNTPSPKNTGTKTWRDMGDVLADIRLAEARKEEELRYCQDTEYGKQITDRYEAELKPLWAEYNELRGTEA